MDLKDNRYSYNSEPDRVSIKDDVNRKLVKFQVTENLSKLGIIEFIMYGYESEHILSFDFNNNKKCYFSFSPRKISVTNLLKELKKKLLQTIGSIDDYKGFNSSLIDIENQIIEHRNEIFNVPSDDGLDNNNPNNNNYHEIDNFKIKFIEDVIALRNQWI